MERKSLIKYETGYGAYLNEKSILVLIDTLTVLDSIKPYAELTENGEIGEFIEKKHPDIPIRNAREFSSFYEALTNKISELASTDKKAEKYLQQINYQRELNKLPSLLSKLEKISFEELEPKFRAIFEYVYDAVMKEGFEMNNDKCEIKKNEYFFDIPSIMIKGNKTKFTLSKKESDIRIRLYHFLGEGKTNGWDIPAKWTIKEMIEVYKKCLLINYVNGKNSPAIVQIKTILSLPTIMNNHLKEKISKLEGCLKEINK